MHSPPGAHLLITLEGEAVTKGRQLSHALVPLF